MVPDLTIKDFEYCIWYNLALISVNILYQIDNNPLPKPKGEVVQ